MKNYLLLSLIGLCTVPSIQSAACREIQEEKKRLEEERLIATFGEQSLTSQLAESGKATAENDPELEFALINAQALIDSIRTSGEIVSQATKAKITEAISDLENKLTINEEGKQFVGNKAQKKRANTKLTTLNNFLVKADKMPLINHVNEFAEKKTGRTIYMSSQEEGPADPKNIYAQKSSAVERLRFAISALSQLCDPKKPATRIGLNFCPNHGLTDRVCQATPYILDSPLMHLPTLISDKGKPVQLRQPARHQDLNEARWMNWVAENSDPNHLKVISVLQLTNAFDKDFLLTKEHEQLIKDLKKIFCAHFWKCDCPNQEVKITVVKNK